MFKRLAVYYKEMFPLLPRFFVAAIMFFEIYFVLLLNDGVTTFHFDHQELIGIFTIFVFLMILRIADDFKDYEPDRRLFPHRALPSGRVKKTISAGSSFSISTEPSCPSGSSSVIRFKILCHWL